MKKSPGTQQPVTPQTPPTATARELAWMVGLILLAFALLMPGLTWDSIWHDEFRSIDIARGRPHHEQRTLPELWVAQQSFDPNAPPGHFMTLNLWGSAVGWRPPALRLLSVLYGIIGAVATYRLGRDLFGAGVGRLAFALLAVNVFGITFWHESRMYATVFMLTPLALWLYWQMTRHAYRRLWLLFLLVAVACFWFHYFAVAPLVAIGVYHVLSGGWRWLRTRHLPPLAWWSVPLALVLAGLSLLPWLPVVLRGVGIYAGDTALHQGALDAGEMIARMLHLFGNSSTLLTAATGLLIGIGVLFVPRPLRGRVGWLWVLLIGTFLVILTLNLPAKAITAERMRYLVGLWSPLALVVAFGAWRLSDWLGGRLPLAGRIGGAALVGAYFVGGLPLFYSHDYTEVPGNAYRLPTHHVEQILRGLAQPTDMIVNFTEVFGRDLRGASEIDYGLLLATDYLYLSDRSDRPDVPANGLAYIDYRITENAPLSVALERERLWVVYNEADVPATFNTALSQIERNYRQCSVLQDAPDLHVALYARAGVCCAPGGGEVTPTARYGTLIALAAEPLPAEVSAALPVVLAWQLDASVPPHVYSVSLQVLNAMGEKVAQVDEGLLPQAHICQRTVIDVSGLPAGEYTVGATVYAWETGEQLGGELLATGATGTLLPIGNFRVGNASGE
jgi:hypothetical protein